MQQAHIILVGSGGQPYRDWDGTEPWAEEVHAQVTAAHTALGVEAGVTHAEIRLTSRGPRLVELNGRLGGDLIPYAGQLATGVDLVRAAAAVALRERPDLTPTRALTTEVRFLYPPHDGRVAAVSVGRAAELPGVAHAATLVAPGDTPLLPPRHAIPRLAVLIAEAADEAGCAEVLARALPEVTSEVVPLTGGPADEPARPLPPGRPADRHPRPVLLLPRPRLPVHRDPPRRPARGRHRRRRALLRRGRRRQPRRRPPADRRCAAAAPGHPSSARCCGSSAT
ncbi:hypothetical protein [Streptomyces albidoflavus]|uniref:hypothetical protein n=1 Tax=Streptomyces albidoflavus TaxID=1886 RepID=UPI002B270CC6|nr:hypothetical protein [Streptomyces albidoflavus]